MLAAQRITIPPSSDRDTDDVQCSLTVAKSLWTQGEKKEALKWLRRAAEQASDAEDDIRSLELYKMAADVATLVSKRFVPAAVPSASPTPPEIAPAAVSDVAPRAQRPEAWKIASHRRRSSPPVIPDDVVPPSTIPRPPRTPHDLTGNARRLDSNAAPRPASNAPPSDASVVIPLARPVAKPSERPSARPAVPRPTAGRSVPPPRPEEPTDVDVPASQTRDLALPAAYDDLDAPTAVVAPAGGGYGQAELEETFAEVPGMVASTRVAVTRNEDTGVVEMFALAPGQPAPLGSAVAIIVPHSTNDGDLLTQMFGL